MSRAGALARGPLRRGLAILGLAAAAGAICWGTTRAVAAARFRAGLDRARAEASAGRYEEARRWLAGLPFRQASDPEAAFLLGVCEHAAGHLDAALAAWSRVAPGSPRGAQAALARGQTLASDLGRFAEAEAVWEPAMAGGGPVRVGIMHALSQLYFFESRREAMRRLILDHWRDSPDPAAELRDLWLIDDATTQMELVTREVERAARLAPDDDRVWLARANLAIAAGEFDPAGRWLDACERRRPGDPAVWRARLARARASDRLDEARRALDRLPAGELSEAEFFDLRAWIASKRGDVEEERRALERLLAIEPGAARALDRLAVLGWEAKQADQAAELRRRKARLDEVKDRYRRLLADSAPADGYAELAGLAEALGRPAEAEGWWTLAARRDSGNPAVIAGLARSRGRPATGPTPVSSEPLAGRLADLLGTGSRADVGQKIAGLPAGGSIAFRDDAEAAGLRFTFDNGRSPLRQLPETTAGGVGLLDFDGDGWLDVYAIQGGPFPPDPSRPSPGDRLFRNRGDGTFEDATERAGLATTPRGFGQGIAVGDFDGDGRPDLFLTRWRSYILLRNRGDGTFEDATERAGLGGDRDWPTSAAFADLDNDGDLDLYVCHYLRWDAEHPTPCKRTSTTAALVEPDRPYDYCMPHPFPALPDHLFRNDGGRFVDVSAGAGIVDRDGRGLGVVAADVDEDGLIDLFVANDTTANYLFHNLGGLKFEEVGLPAGVACNAEGAFQAGMGTACGDLDGDGKPDLAVTNFYGESTTFFRNLGGGMFADQTSAVGLSAPSRFLLGFGVAFLDVNDDGRLDLATANGHVIDERPNFPYEMPAQLLLGGADGRLADASASAGPPWRVPRVARGMAVGDLDNDGRIDLLLMAQQAPLAYFHNRSAGGHSITLRLEGTASNRDGVGAVVTLTAGGRRQVVPRLGGGSFQSAADPRVRFGLGTADRADSVEVRWPSGRIDRHRNLRGDAGYVLREGEGEPKPLPGFAPRGPVRPD